jgi:hypothetical protein
VSRGLPESWAAALPVLPATACAQDAIFARKRLPCKFDFHTSIVAPLAACALRAPMRHRVCTIIFLRFLWKLSAESFTILNQSA